MDLLVSKNKVLDQVEDLVRNRIAQIGPVHDDYDGGQKAAYDKVFSDLITLMPCPSKKSTD